MEENTTSSETKKSSFNPMLIAVIAIVAVVGIGAFVLMKGNSTPSDTANSTPTQASQNEEDAMKMNDVTPTQGSVEGAMTNDMQVISIEAGSFYYKPNEIKVKKGQKVKIEMKAVSMMHDFNIDELNVHAPITKNGDTATFEFTADQAGTFEYYCSVGNHRANGQVGKLIVE